MLSDATLDACRNTLHESFPDECNIIHVALASDGAGGQTETVTSTGPVPCRITPLGLGSGAERETAERFTGVSLWILTVPHDTVLTVRDRVVCDGITYEVREVNVQRSWLLCVRAFLVRID